MLNVSDIVGTIEPTGAFVNSTSGYLKSKVQSFIEFFIGVVILASIIGIIYNGLMFITAGGDSNQVDKATKGIIYSVIGLIIAFAAGLVVSFAVDFLKSK